MDYLIIGCSKNSTGQGWTKTVCSQEPFLKWINRKLNFEQSFGMFAQARKLMEDIQEVGPSSQGSSKKRRENPSDVDKMNLGRKLNDALGEFLRQRGFFRSSARKLTDSLHNQSKSLVNFHRKGFLE